MKTLLLSILLICVAASCSAQSFFKPLPKHEREVVVTRPGFAAKVSATDSVFFAFRPVANIAAISVPSFSAMAGAGFGVQNLDYNFATQRYYCNFSINAVMFAGGNIAPATPTPTLTYAIMLGALNNTVMAGAGINGGKAQFIASIGINFNN